MLVADTLLQDAIVKKMAVIASAQQFEHKTGVNETRSFKAARATSGADDHHNYEESTHAFSKHTEVEHAHPDPSHEPMHASHAMPSPGSHSELAEATITSPSSDLSIEKAKAAHRGDSSESQRRKPKLNKIKTPPPGGGLRAVRRPRGTLT